MKNFLSQYSGFYRVINSTRNIFLKLKFSKLLVGKQTILKNVFFEGHVSIGDFVLMTNSSCKNHTYISYGSIIHNTQIGKFCSIGSGIKAGLGKHPVNNFISTHPAFYSLQKQSGKTFVNQQKFDESDKVIIGNDVWIGSNAIILDGVKIGNGAIIAAGAVVTKDVKPYEIVGGVPAKHIRFRFTDEEIEKIQSTEWWNKDEEWLQKNADTFSNKDQFLSLIST